MGSKILGIISHKTIKVLCQFLIPPLVLVLLWFSLPLASGVPYVYILSTYLYYSWQLFAWLSFFDFLFPNCPRVLLISSVVVFLVASGITLYIFWIFELYSVRWYFTLFGVIELLCSTGCYLAHIVRVRYSLI
jgi:hypothetical protein